MFGREKTPKERALDELKEIRKTKGKPATLENVINRLEKTEAIVEAILDELKL